MTSHLDSQRKSDPKPEILSAVYTGNRIQSDGRNTLGIVEKREVREVYFSTVIQFAIIHSLQDLWYYLVLSNLCIKGIAEFLSLSVLANVT